LEKIAVNIGDSFYKWSMDVLPFLDADIRTNARAATL
jgi:hypothetical protein